MICQNCQASVDNDLVFCTNCGSRLHEKISETPTVLLSDSVVTKTSTVSPAPPKSNFKWIALIIALIALPSLLFVGYLLLKPENQPAQQTVAQPKTPVPSPTRTAATNLNSSSNVAESTVDPANSDFEENVQNTDVSINSEKTNLWGERIEISPNSNYAVPFKIDTETAQITGEINLVQGEPLAGYVFLKEVYEEHYVDPNFKVFSFDVTKDSTIEQTLPEGDYVLILVNQNKRSSTIQSDLYITKNRTQ